MVTNAAKTKGKAKASAQQLLAQRAKTSSERGRAFRERERLHVEALERSIQELQKQIHEKTFLRSVWNAKYLRSRHTLNGSLSRLVEEYYTIVRFGVRELPAIEATSKENGDRVDPVEFLSRVTHPCAILGDVVGPESMVDQWRKYTAAHAQYEAQIYGLDVRGPEEDPVVFAQLKLSGRLTRKTFEILFPHALRNEQLVQQLIGKCITYYGTTLIRFSHDMKIVCQDVHLNFVSGFGEVGVSVEDINQLMGKSTISPTCTILDQPANAATAT